MKKSELKRNIEDESYNETLDKQTYYTFKQNQTKRKSKLKKKTKKAQVKLYQKKKCSKIGKEKGTQAK